MKETTINVTSNQALPHLPFKLNKKKVFLMFEKIIAYF